MPEPQILTVAQLSGLIKQVMETSIPEVWVEGEVSNLSRPQSGHYYFTLKDKTAQIRGVIWRSTAQRLKFEPRDGMRLICAGAVDVYPPRGTYQLVARFAEPAGVGPLQVAFRQLHQKLQREGLFDPDRKSPLPKFPKRIGVVTSPSGAAVRDFLQVYKRRWDRGEIMIIPSRVQGTEASGDVVRAIRTANRIRPALDILVITRGGGSLEDLWCFNEESVVRAIDSSTIPTLSAIGHEIDVTLSDLVADERALTPSEAAEKTVPSYQELARRLNRNCDSLNQLLLMKLDASYQKLIQIESRPILRRPLQQIRDFERRLDEIEARSSELVTRHLSDRRKELQFLTKQLEAVSPLSILARGYSVTQTWDPQDAGERKLVDSIGKVKPGEKLQTQVRDGVIFSEVIDSHQP